MSAYWVYRCYDGSGRLIYVGCTSNLPGRLTTHRSRAWWAPQVARVVARVYPSRAVAGPIEREAIASENPRWNIVGRWASNWSWNREDFEDYITALSAPGRATTYDTSNHIERAQLLMEQRHPKAAA